MYKAMDYVKQTASYGNFIKPDTVWDRVDRSFAFTLLGRSDSEYASDPDTRHSVSRGTVFLNSAVICAFSRMQKCVIFHLTGRIHR
jgi:hypothetical protein